MGLPAHAYFFGVIEPGKPGHYFYLPNGQSWNIRNTLPFNPDLIDGMLLPKDCAQVQGLVHVAVINGWTILSAWDRTGDTRMGSLAAFIFEGEFMNLPRLIRQVETYFPILWKRIEPKIKIGDKILPFA